MRWLCLLVWVVGCDVASMSDSGVDAPRPDAPRIDGGFSRDALAPCMLEDGAGFDASDYASFDFGAASATTRRLFFPLRLIEGVEAASALADRRARARAAIDCEGDAACVRGQLGFDDVAANAASEEVAAALVAAGQDVEVDAALRASGACALLEASDTFVADCIARTLIELSAGLGFVGEIASVELAVEVQSIADRAASEPFAFALITLIEEGLVLADRLEPVRYEPLEEENAAAIEALFDVDWDAFPFVAIVVPGQGPTDATTALNPAGRARADLGYDRWAAGLAPVIVLSGGHVHPDRTTFSEAVEMRRYLVSERDVPASAILIDPYARHTTTNLRDVSRVLARAGVPMDRPVLITTDLFQSTYISSGGFAARCEEELGYRPFEQMARLSSQDLCFAASRESLTLAASDPLDP